MHEAVKLGAFRARLLDCIPDDHEATGEDLQMVARAAKLFRPAFHIGIELAACGEVRLRRENSLGRLGGKLASCIGGASLDDHRPALDWARDVERAADREIPALMVEHVQLVRIEINPIVDVANEGIICPAVPQTRDHVIEFTRASITIACSICSSMPKLSAASGLD